MGRALDTVSARGILQANPKLVFRDGSYSYQIVRQGTVSIYTVTDGKSDMTAPIAWAFGLGAAGQTYVYHWNGNWYESRVSFYRKAGGLDLTMGALNAAPKNLEEAAGRRMSVKDSVECFHCHATNAIRANRVDTDHMTPGVQCERCHGPSEKHVAASKSGDAKEAAMRKLGALTTEEMSDFCGQCHRTWSQIAMDGPHNLNNVRFQPYRLTNSKCYDASDTRIRCVACHDPHREVDHNAAFYDAKCLACHGAVAARPAAAKVCRTATEKCVTCHMPKYEVPGSHNLFSDHWIRVVKAGEAYPD
ncbi:MAG TPA: multiheme c-type cytochrome [Bryobacteraceae bacterium]|nr:multiheme c-type cytochrome [Bryobacteraceae bacterium]